MNKLLYLAALNLAKNPGRALALILCISGPVFLFISGAAISAGISRDAAASIESGADLYVTRDRGGLDANIEVRYVAEFRKSMSVVEVRPRIVARVTPAPETWAVLLGIDPLAAEEQKGLQAGRLFRADSRSEVVMGAALARRLGLGVGNSFILSTSTMDRILKVVGIVSKNGTLWGSAVIWAPFSLAQELLGMPGVATDILIRTRDEVMATRLADHLSRADARLRIQTKDLVRRYVSRGYAYTGGVFSAVYAVALGLAIPAVLVISGFGTKERRREIALLKVSGWPTTHVLVLVTLEAWLCSLLACGLSFLAAFVWVRWLNAPLLAKIFIAELEWFPLVAIPSHFNASILGLTLLVSLIITWTGTLLPSWRTASIPAAETLQ